MKRPRTLLSRCVEFKGFRDLCDAAEASVKAMTEEQFQRAAAHGHPEVLHALVGFRGGSLLPTTACDGFRVGEPESYCIRRLRVSDSPALRTACAEIYESTKDGAVKLYVTARDFESIAEYIARLHRIVDAAGGRQ